MNRIKLNNITNHPSIVVCKTTNSWGSFNLKNMENNGWIKIESENDLPKENCNLWVIEDREDFSKDPVLIRFMGSFFTPIHKTCTHYQPIEKPLPPIY